ncbi:MAG: hypothetical protein ACPL1F_01435 [bacterium]
MILELQTNNEIINLNFNHSLMNLPTADIRIASSSIDYPTLFYFLILRILNKLTNNYSLSLNLNFEITNRSWDGLLNLNLIYGNIFNFTFTPPSNTKITTLCNQSITSIYNFYLSLLNCFTSYFSASPIYLSNYIFYKYEPYDTSLLDFLNQLEQFGYFWFLEFKDNILPKLSLVDILNLPTSIETINMFSNINISTEYPLYNTVKLVKEPDTDNLPKEIILDKENPCITLPYPISTMGISYTVIHTEGPYPYVLYFDGKGGIGGQVSELASSLRDMNAVGKQVEDCQGRYKFLIRGVAACACCMNVIRDICDRYDSQTETTDCGCSSDCMSCFGFPLDNNCVSEIRIEPAGAFGIQQLSKNTKVKIHLDWSYICLSPSNTPDCLITGHDAEFRNTLLTHLITVNNKYSCNVAPYEIRISNINDLLWERFKQYQSFKSIKKKRVITLENPILNQLSLGYTYDIRLNNVVFNKCLLTSYTIQTTSKGWSLNATFEQYI